MKHKLCEKCEKYVSNILAQLQKEAKKNHRGKLVIDCLTDVEVSLEDGNINRVVERDDEYRKGNRVGRKIEK